MFREQVISNIRGKSEKMTHNAMDVFFRVLKASSKRVFDGYSFWGAPFGLLSRARFTDIFLKIAVNKLV